MGIVAKQSIRGSIWSYAGVAIGFVTTSYFFTYFLTPQVVGLFGLLIAIANITSNIAALGMNSVTLRLFPYFRNNENGHNGYLLSTLLPLLFGFLLFILFFFLFKDRIIENNIEKSPLFAQYVYLIVPITFFFLIFNFFDTYNRLLYNAVLGTFLQEFVQRVLVLVLICLYILHLLSIHQVILGYAFVVSLKSLIIIIYLYTKRELNLRPNFKFISPKLRKEIINVAGFSLIGGIGSLLVFQIDKIVINQLLDLKNTGVYTIAFFFGTLVIIPSRPLIKISGTLIADAWATNDLQNIKDIYYKSCLNQFLIGGFLFLGLWANIHNIMAKLPADYLDGKWVIFFIGIGYLFDMLTGTNGQIIAYSKYYRINLLFTSILLISNIVLLYTLIPIWGIVGAAVSIASSLFLNNLMRSIYLYRKYKLQPFDFKYLIILAFFVGIYFALSLIPHLNFILDILIRGSIICIAVFLFIQKTSYFPDISDSFKYILGKYLIRK